MDCVNLKIVFSLSQNELFSAPSFSYIYYLLYFVMNKSGHVVKGDEQVLCQVLGLVKEHSMMRRTATDHQAIDVVCTLSFTHCQGS